MRIQSFINGMLVGLMIGILYAPESGQQTRRKISRKASNLKDSLEDTYDDFKEGVADEFDRVKNKAENLVNKGERYMGDNAGSTGGTGNMYR